MIITIERNGMTTSLSTATHKDFRSGSPAFQCLTIGCVFAQVHGACHLPHNFDLYNVITLCSQLICHLSLIVCTGWPHTGVVCGTVVV